MTEKRRRVLFHTGGHWTCKVMRMEKKTEGRTSGEKRCEAKTRWNGAPKRHLGLTKKNTTKKRGGGREKRKKNKTGKTKGKRERRQMGLHA